MDTYVIIKSNKRGEKNWSGKGFSDQPAKVCHAFADAADALNAYWFNEGAVLHNQADTRPVRIIHLSEKEKDAMLRAGTIKF